MERVNQFVIALMLFGLVLCPGHSQAKERPLLTRQDRRSVEQVVLLSPGELSLSRTTELAETFLHRWRGKQFKHLVMLTTVEDLPAIQFGKGRSHTTLSEWNEYHRLHRDVPRPQAEVVSFDRFSTLRLREGDGKVLYKNLSQSSAFELTFNQERIVIDFVSFQEVLPHSHPQLQVSLYVVAKLSGVREAEALYTFLSTKTSLTNLEVTVRPDTWFLDSGYPWINPYQENVAFPSCDEYRGEAGFSCGASCVEFKAECGAAHATNSAP